LQIDSCFCIKGFHFSVSLVSEDSTVLEKTAFPFSVVTDTDPLAGLLEAGIVTGAGSEVEKLFLLVQRDRYLLTEDELRPVTNRDIEESWRNAFSFYNAEDRGLILLPGQTDGEGRLMPFPPQFFCKARRIFFHPPCPKCGLPLQQCEDDGLLDASGLQPYSGSLRRYLYCAQCTPAGRSGFYAYDEEPATAVRDRRALIRKFRLLAEGGNHAEQFPCPECPEHRECYGTDQRAVSRIAPFSFYPFYMFAFKAMSLNAPDFLSLVSGAEFGDVESVLGKKQEAGRIKRLKDIRQRGNLTKAPFLFGSDDRFFLEVLYLKLCFLGEALRFLCRGDDLLMHPGLRPSVERIWVSLPPHGGLLPFLWNFRVNLVGIFTPPAGGGSFHEPAGTESLFYTGLLWFNTLLANSRQDVSRVNASLRGIVDHCRKGGDFSFQDEMKDPDPVFSPVNVFWNPEGKTVGEEFITLWHKALDLSLSLLRAGSASVPSFSMENFRQRSEGLMKEISGLMFTEAPAGTAAPAPEDAAIHGILRSIYNKWSSGAVTEEKESTETVILSSQVRKEETTPAAPPKQEDSGVIEETVIISRQDAGRPSAPEEPAGEEKKGDRPEDSGDSLEETVIIRPAERCGDEGKKDGTK